jgi:proline dehydrogenase
LHRLGKSDFAGGWQPEKINISIKLTQLGLIEDEEKATRRLIHLLSVAKQYKNFVRVDMEESACTDRTLTSVVRGFEEHGNVGVAIQSMLFRSDKDVPQLNERGIRMRLVKGAYLEPPEVGRQAKADVDQAYVTLGKEMLINGTYPAFGTHDDVIIKQLRAYAEENKIDKGTYEFQMLFGIRQPMQAALKDAGVNVRVYVPYGTSWYPYFSRRLAERPANLLFFIRALFTR